MIKLFKNFKSQSSSPEPSPKVEMISFQPLQGFSSPHAQTVMAYLTPAGSSPPSTQLIVPVTEEEALSCEVSTPPSWISTNKTVFLVHGLGGSHLSSYMVRLSKKLYEKGIRAVRVNMRCCGSGKDLAKKPYHGGLSEDILKVLIQLKKETPLSPFILVGFSLGGNIALKLAAEIEKTNKDLIHSLIAVCPAIDLAETAEILSQPDNRIYNRFYMSQLESMVNTKNKKYNFSTMSEFDTLITAPNFGFANPKDYYQKSSSRYLLGQINHPCRILLAMDDPFINHLSFLNVPLSDKIKIFISEYGGHIGFFGWTNKEHRYYWLDQTLLNWINELS